MKSDRLRPGDEIIVNGETYVFTRCERNGRYWSVHFGDKIVTCTLNFEWLIATRFKRKKKRRKNGR